MVIDEGNKLISIIATSMAPSSSANVRALLTIWLETY